MSEKDTLAGLEEEISIFESLSAWEKSEQDFCNSAVRVAVDRGRPTDYDIVAEAPATLGHAFKSVCSEIDKNEVQDEIEKVMSLTSLKTIAEIERRKRLFMIKMPDEDELEKMIAADVANNIKVPSSLGSPIARLQEEYERDVQKDVNMLLRRHRDLQPQSPIIGATSENRYNAVTLGICIGILAVGLLDSPVIRKPVVRSFQRFIGR